MAAFEDTYTESSDTLLTLHVPNVGTAWTLDSGDSSNLVVRALNNSLVSTAVARTFVRSDDLGDADCYVEAELSTLSAQNGRYVVLRAQDSANFIGWLLAGTGGAGMRLVKVVSGNTTNLFTMQGIAGRVYRIEAEGTTIRFYEDGVQQGSDITESVFQTETKQGIVAFNTDSTTDFISTYNADVLGGGGGVTLSPITTESQSNSISPIISLTANISLLPNITESTSEAINPSVDLTSLVAINPVVTESVSESVNPTLIITSKVQLTPQTTESESEAISPTIVLGLVVSINPAVTESETTSVSPTISLTDTIVLTPTITESSSEAIPAIISLSVPISIVPNITESITEAINPSIVLTGTVDLSPILTESQSEAINPTINLSFGLTITPNTTESISEAISPNILLGSVFVIESFTIAYSDGGITPSYVTEGITVSYGNP